MDNAFPLRDATGAAVRMKPRDVLDTVSQLDCSAGSGGTTAYRKPGTAPDFSVRVWELATGKLEATLKGHTNYIKSLAITPDGRKIVSGSFDRTVRVWTP